MKKINVAVNGLGRIGRAFVKLALAEKHINIVAVNDLGSADTMAYLLNYDSAYGRSGLDAKADGTNIVVGGHPIKHLSEKEPSKLPWKELDIDVVIESTGFFASFNEAKAHIDAGAKKVIITAPVKDSSQEGATVLLGVNEEKGEGKTIISNASCTTNASSPVMAILDEAIGIEKAILNTVHAYTGSQAIVDGPSKKDVREGRAAAQNIVPSSTGAAIAVTKALPQLEGKFDGISIRVPVVVGSIVDITFIAKRATTVEEVNSVLTKASGDSRWGGIFSVTNEPLVSHDIVGNTHASIADLSFTRVVGGNLVKVLAWYDNEMGYANTLIKQVIKS